MSANDFLPWSVIQEEIERQIEACRTQLETASAAGVPVLQGRIAGLRAALDAPKTIRASVDARREATP
jgi:hypothetical protein